MIARAHRRIGRKALVLFAALSFASSAASAQEPASRVEIGLAARFMPTGWFEWSGRTPPAESDLRAIPALGGAPFVDYRLNPALSLGFMPELTLNVIPNTISNYRSSYPISAMLAGSLRIKVEYPDLRSVAPYLLLAPGYSALFDYGDASAESESGDAHGFVLSAYAGLRVPIGARHSVFAEGGYMRGFQKNGGRRYAPSYVVVALGWQMAL
jgi:hypothetical protein